MKINNIKLINDFYQYWLAKDRKGIKNSYHKDCLYNNPFAIDLNSKEIIRMWMSLFAKNSKTRIDAEFEIIKATDKSVHTVLIIKYRSRKRKNKIIIRVKTLFEFKEGKIVFQKDSFDTTKFINEFLDFKNQKPSFIYTIIKWIITKHLKKEYKK